VGLHWRHDHDEGSDPTVSDVLFLLLTGAVFALLAAILKAVERL
jgi:hypothetical protein